MTTSAVGLVVDEHDVGIGKLIVSMEDVSQQFDVLLDTQTTTPEGGFGLRYVGYKFEPSTPGRQIRKLRLRVRVGRHVVKEILQDDLPTDDHITFPKIQLTREEAESWWATLGTGKASRKTDGNAVRWLADNFDGWDRVATVIENSGQRFADDPSHKCALDVMQLTIDCAKFHPDQPPQQGEFLEDPMVVLRFDPTAGNELTPANERALNAKDVRIERAILKAYQAGAEVRIQLPKPTLDKHGAVVVGTAILGTASFMLLGGTIAIIAGILFAIEILGLIIIGIIAKSQSPGDPPTIQWFQDAGKLPTRDDAVSVKQLHMRSNQFTHCKLVIDRNREAVLLGSPMEQDYYDSLQHAVDDPRRGKSADKGPIHDVSVAVRGPVVGHMQELFNNHWNLAAPDDKLPVPAPTLPAITQSGDKNEFIAPAQFVRTLDASFTEDFDPPAPNGEQGVLEAYLRAIAFAERFIYIENQYFNNDIITHALIDALATKPDLVVILFLNSAPDMWCYLKWQQQAIDQINDSLKDAAKARVGVFSAWSHAKSDNKHPKPRLVDNYLHTKSAIVDNRWATVGSANLDGASLDSIQYARAAFGGDVRNTEGNLVVFEETPPARSAVDALRRRLWSEHLGIADPASNVLDDGTGKKLLELWTGVAQRKLDGLKTNLDQVLAFDGPRTDGIQSHVLPWPTDSKFFDKLGFFERKNPHKVARAHLSMLLSPDNQPSDVLMSQFDVLTDGPESFPFKYKKP